MSGSPHEGPSGRRNTGYRQERTTLDSERSGSHSVVDRTPQGTELQRSGQPGLRGVGVRELWVGRGRLRNVSPRDVYKHPAPKHTQE